MKQYIAVTNRIIRTIEGRSELTGRHPGLSDIHDQLALRSLCMSRSTISVEIASVRKIVSEAFHDGHEILWPQGVEMREWLSYPSEKDLQKLKERLSKPHKDIMDEGAELAVKEVLLAEENGLSLSMEESIERLAGKVSGQSARQNQKDQRHLTWRDLMSLEVELSGKDPYVAINSLREDTLRGSVEGLLRLFINVMWFTGLRPTEVWGCALFVPRFDLDYGRAELELIEKSPADALRESLLVGVESLAKSISEPPGFTANQACDRSRAPAILLIKSAKQTNAVKEIRLPVRLQILKNIPSQQLSLIAIASGLRSLQMPKERQDTVHNSMNKALKRIGSNTDNLRDLVLNLYAFRHSFATRAKAAYEPWEAAALTGHTSRNTLYGYGERNRRRPKESGRTRVTPEKWMPLPDPVQAKLLAGWWSRAATPAPGIALVDAPPQPVGPISG